MVVALPLLRRRRHAGALGGWVNWTIAGPSSSKGTLRVPPRASIDVTETLASSKYPAYKEYQAAVSRIVPWFPGKAAKAAAALSSRR